MSDGTAGTGKYTYSWTLNGTVVGATEKYTVPASAVTGDVIIVTVTDENGNTASDTAVVATLRQFSVERGKQLLEWVWDML